MSSITTPTKPTNLALDIAGKSLNEVDERYHPAAGIRRQLNKVFPTHWSFLLGEIALYSFIVLLLSGVYLALWFDPSMTDVQYNGPFSDLRGVYMSKAYASTLDISFVVRGGLFVRQLHHWAALLFMAAMAAHMIRIFFTGAFRKPRETNWVIGVLLLVLGGAEGFTGYGLPDDLLSGTGVRAALSGGMLSVPVIGTWLHWLLFGGEFPGTAFVPRMYAIHIVLIPGIILALIAVHLGLVWYQKHTQFPGVRRTEKNVVGVRIMPVFAIKGGGFFAVVVGILALIAGLFQINPVWNFGPYSPAQVSAGSQPDWYLAWTDGLLRLWPDWEIYFGHTYMIPAVFFPLMVFGLVITVMMMYPFLERRLSKDHASHNLLQRPRDAPVRTGLGAMGLTFMLVCTISCANDIIANKLHISLNAMTWGGRIGVLILPPILYYVTYRICIGLQRSDREVLEHGIETGIIKRLPSGEFIEVHQPLGGTDEHGHAKPLEYQGAPVPKKMNKLGSAGHPLPGSLLRADPIEETVALERAEAEQHAAHHESDEAVEHENRELPVD
ncbi:MAG TPA: cytochrome bc complex cytochrome b subunit [Pseudonocardiaceae bacterium]|jgi:ubiquinol-cytochrome c reductase cytochrome b subunit|nr:cytochrome bc complex cytochrome b subunit [Pseudonocardiaceae bacterium]